MTLTATKEQPSYSASTLKELYEVIVRHQAGINLKNIMGLIAGHTLIWEKHERLKVCRPSTIQLLYELSSSVLMSWRVKFSRDIKKPQHFQAPS